MTAEKPSAYDVTIRLLARRDHSRCELISKLKQRRFTTVEIDEALTRLDATGLQSDARFASAYSREQIARGRGPQRVIAALQQRGVASAIISEVLHEQDPDWLGIAKNIRSKKFGDDIPSDFRERAKQMRFLQQRGFDNEQIRAIISESE